MYIVWNHLKTYLLNSVRTTQMICEWKSHNKLWNGTWANDLFILSGIRTGHERKNDEDSDKFSFDRFYYPYWIQIYSRNVNSFLARTSGSIMFLFYFLYIFASLFWRSMFPYVLLYDFPFILLFLYTYNSLHTTLFARISIQLICKRYCECLCKTGR